MSRKSEVDLLVFHLSLPMILACLLNGNNAFHLHSTSDKAQEELEDLATNLYGFLV